MYRKKTVKSNKESLKKSQVQNKLQGSTVWLTQINK